MNSIKTFLFLIVSWTLFSCSDPFGSIDSKFNGKWRIEYSYTFNDTTYMGNGYELPFGTQRIGILHVNKNRLLVNEIYSAELAKLWPSQFGDPYYLEQVGDTVFAFTYEIMIEDSLYDSRYDFLWSEGTRKVYKAKYPEYCLMLSSDDTLSFFSKVWKEEMGAGMIFSRVTDQSTLPDMRTLYFRLDSMWDESGM